MARLALSQPFDRRSLLGGLSLALLAAGLPRAVTAAGPALPQDAPLAEILKLTGGRLPVRSERFTFDLPAIFANGYTVPLSLAVESPMTDAAHARRVHVLAPGNPFLRVASFRFTPSGGRARVSTRIRLAAPQNVYGIAELSGGDCLIAHSWVEVEINGCAS